MASSSSRLAGVAPLLLTAVLCLQLPTVSRAQLQVGFYEKTCPDAETLVRQAVAAAFAKNNGIAAGLIRLHFHDCFVRGCDASVLLVSANGMAERDAMPNKPSLRGFEVPSGRRDGNISLMKDADENLPLPTFTLQQLIHLFAKKTLTAEEMVTLVGAHTIGRSFCSSFLSRIWNNTNPIVDEGLSSGYAKLLRSLCPSTPNNSTTTVIDPSTPTVLDNNYYKLLPLNLGLFFSDNQLRTNAALNASVNTFADSEALWNEKFWKGMIKMGNIEVLTGTQGEIRLNCSVVNKITGMEMAHYYSGSASSVDEIVTS
ncbi:hypothetical protein BRADI_2g12192v3 [Brachypodium distachyon]|uniref:Peroxidase n=1 Tax=Brachypodium distachyon TaxID=15368 RepID=A0A2K2D845_BRADI|nr:hypothetical protein BRADI_2g12192v3 [Brachypodium distachyon]